MTSEAPAKIFPEKIGGLPRFARRIWRNRNGAPTYTYFKFCVCGISLKYTHKKKKGPRLWLECSRCGEITGARTI